MKVLDFIFFCALLSVGSTFDVSEKQQTEIFDRLPGTNLPYYFTKAKIYSKYRMYLLLHPLPGKYYSTVGDITLTNVIVCGKFYPTYIFTGQSIALYGATDIITMTIDSTKAYRFVVDYVLKEMGKKLYATDYYQEVATPNFPGPYEKDCRWLIYPDDAYYGVLVDIIYSDLGTDTDAGYISIVEGDVISAINLKGAGERTFTSTSGFIEVKFQSDSPLSKSCGALIRYIRGPAHYESIPGIVVGCIAVAAIGFGVVCVICLRRKKRNRPTPPQNNSSYHTTSFILRTTSNDTSSQPPSYSEVTRHTTIDHSSNDGLPSYEASWQFEIPKRSAETADHLSIIDQPSPELPPSNDELPSYEAPGQFEMPDRSVETVDHLDIIDQPSPELPPSNDGLPSYETSGQFEIPDRSVDTAYHSSIDQPSPESPPLNDGLPRYDNWRHSEIPAMSVETADHSSIDRPSLNLLIYSNDDIPSYDNSRL